MVINDNYFNRNCGAINGLQNYIFFDLFLQYLYWLIDI